jgi:hypothetical protein
VLKIRLSTIYRSSAIAQGRALMQIRDETFSIANLQ